MTERKKILSTDLVQVTYGNDGGTWVQEDVALEFARWLSPDFAIWCNDKIKELLTTGITTLSVPKTFAQALRLAADQQEEIERQQKLIEEQKPKADYFDNLVERNLLTNFRDTAKQIGIKQTDLINKLLENGYIYRDKSKKIKPYAQYVDKLFKIKDYTTDNGFSGHQTLVTPEGKETFRLLFGVK